MTYDPASALTDSLKEALHLHAQKRSYLVIDSSYGIVQAGMGRIDGYIIFDCLDSAALLVTEAADLLERLENQGMVGENHVAASFYRFIHYFFRNVQAHEHPVHFHRRKPCLQA